MLLGLLCLFLVASEVRGKLNLYTNEGAQLCLEVGSAGVRGVRDFFGVNEVRCCAVASLEESLCLFLG